jgi:hypothetical protein
MAQIYTKATRVLIHLGSDDEEHGTAACSVLTELDARIQKTLDQIDHTWDSFPYPDREERQQLVADGRWTAVGVLLSQQWFSRGWVVQEAGLAKQALVLWANTEFNWQMIVRCHTWLINRHPQLIILYNLFLNPVHMQVYQRHNQGDFLTFVSRHNWVDHDLLSTLNDARQLDLGDERDRLYAFLELFPDTGAFHLVPSYTKHFLDVYSDFARQYVQSEKDLTVFHYVEHTQSSFDDQQTASWVPRWNEQVYANNCFHRWTASTSSGSQDYSATEDLGVSRNNILRVKGVLFDHVNLVSDRLQFRISLDEIAALWDSLTESRIDLSYSSAVAPLAFLTTLTKGEYVGDWLDWLPSQTAFIQYLQQSYSGDASSNETDFILNRVRYNIDSRRFIVTERGYFGLAPMIVRKGDVCCMIFGCKSPFILRKTDMEGHYRLVGEAFITGKEVHEEERGGEWMDVLGSNASKDWTEWDLEEQTIHLF